MEKSSELIVAKINAAIKILEWSKDDIEPGIGQTPPTLYAALGEAFKTVYLAVSEAIAADVEAAGVRQEVSSDADSAPAVPIGE